MSKDVQIERQNNLREKVNQMLVAEYLPEMNSIEKEVKGSLMNIPLENMPQLATLVSSLNNKGMYKVIIPKESKGSLKFSRDKTTLGNMVDSKGKITDRARFKQVPINQTELMMAIILQSIEQKLETIIELEEEILNFLNQDKESKIKGDLKILSEIFSHLKFNWDNEKYVNTNLNLIASIKRNAQANIHFYEKKIEEEISKDRFLHMHGDVTKRLSKLQKYFKYYRLSNYMYSYASFVESILYGNFKREYLSTIIMEIENRMLEYKKNYSKSYEKMKQLSQTSLESQALKLSTHVDHSLSEKISKNKFLKKMKLEKPLNAGGEIALKTYRKMVDGVLTEFVKNKNDGTHVFLENFRTIDQLYNNPIEVYLDQNQVYFITE